MNYSTEKAIKSFMDTATGAIGEVAKAIDRHGEAIVQAAEIRAAADRDAAQTPQRVLHVEQRKV